MDSGERAPPSQAGPGRGSAGYGALVMAAQSLGALGGGSPPLWLLCGLVRVPLSLGPEAQAVRQSSTRGGPTLCSQAGTGPPFHSVEGSLGIRHHVLS